MTPRLEACYFQGPPATPKNPCGSDGRWSRMAAVLEASARRHCPAWRVAVTAIGTAPVGSALGVETYERNTHKLDHWAAVVADAEDRDRLLLIDADTIVLRPLDDVWSLDFDLAYTVRPKRFPLNGGVVFLRVSDRVRAFVTRWAALNRAMLNAPKPTWKAEFGGINQAAFGTLLAEGDHGLTLLGLPCAEWNCEDTSWPSYDPAVTRILHVKDALRRACLSAFDCQPSLRALRAPWQEMDRALRMAGTR